MHYMQCASSYKSKWLRPLKSKVGDVYSDVIKLYSQPRQNTVCARSQVLLSWAQQCVHDVNGLYTLNLLLPSDWRQCINQSVSVANQARLQTAIQPKAKAKAMPKVSALLIGRIPTPLQPPPSRVANVDV